MSIDRRTFVKSLLATGLTVGFPAVATAQRDKTYRTALIGSGWWGTNILREVAASRRCKIVGLVDVDRRQLDKCSVEVAKWGRDQLKLNQPDDQNIKELWADFLNAIETGRRPVSDIEEIHRSTNLSLLGMLSYKLGRSIAWDGEKEACLGDPQANALLKREYRKSWRYPEA